MRKLSKFLAVLAASIAGVTASSHAAGAAMDTAGDRQTSVSAWEPPPGYVYEKSFLGGGQWCEDEGQRGVQAGLWASYVCHDVLRRHADVLFLYGNLYVLRSPSATGTR
ncbi:hypothetical protein ACTMTI_24995 [Nonomuraea sp. H19]|uniref:hypothetical protein n=1 Tax=Nonomuraea sp. H19 TaxID=3452206 RepID=UPI003F89476E